MPLFDAQGAAWYIEFRSPTYLPRQDAACNKKVLSHAEQQVQADYFTFREHTGYINTMLSNRQFGWHPKKPYNNSCKIQNLCYTKNTKIKEAE